MVVIVTTMRSAEVIKRLEFDGWVLRRVKGSHHQFKHPAKAGLVTVPHTRAEIPLGTLRLHLQAGRLALEVNHAFHSGIAQ
jgi:predicted RNA binding protein YcfA (HicA-like mRNA interferase family)